MHAGHLRRLSLPVFADLAERTCCYSLRLAAEWLGAELWMPRSLAELHLGAHDDASSPLGGGIKRLESVGSFKGILRLLSRALEAALRVQDAVASMASGGFAPPAQTAEDMAEAMTEAFEGEEGG